MRTSLNYIDNLTGRNFEKYIYKLFKNDPQYKAKLTPASHDFGLDVIATNKYYPKIHYSLNNKILTYCKRTYGIQCKHTHGTAIGYRAVEEAISGAKYYGIHHTIVLTNGLFTPHAKVGAKRTGVHLINRDGLIKLIKNYYKDVYRQMIQINSKKDILTLDKNLALDVKAMAKIVNYGDESLMIFSALDNFYHTKLSHQQKIEVLSIYNKLLNHN